VISADDLCVFLEVARRGRLADAAKDLQVNHTTVGRHINRLERAVENRLFDRGATGWTLTDVGERLLAYAELVEAGVLGAQEEFSAKSGTLSGAVRVICPDGFGVFVLMPGLAAVRERHPGLVVEVLTANRHSSLSAREFDLAITIERPKARAVLTSRLANYRLQFYASSDYLARCSEPVTINTVGNHPLIWYIDAALDEGTLSGLYDLVPDARPAIQTNNIVGQINAAEAGLGIAFLPSYIGDQRTELRRIGTIDEHLPRSYWLSVPRDLSRLGRVRAMVTALQQLADHVGSVPSQASDTDH
jgi:DNA-binding transcriptional LysR family regulator